ncbi:vWA domain-containing protein [Nannocystis pusilla]|uniref:vWA domain-containing protein n=1 Tax=Nannocystis pusilla TaxID=889268 RepID=UPI003B7BDDCC
MQYLAQLGFSSGLDPKTFKRAPLNLVAVIDKSGSMSGQPLDLVRESLYRVLDQLGPDDQLSIVLYGDRAHVHMSPTAAKDKRAIAARIAGIESAGSTAMEEGLQVGYDLARRSGHGFKGTTRVMLFTDERPNVGATDKQSFMGMARDASRGGSA